jgi:hypothetical protein
MHGIQGACLSAVFSIVIANALGDEESAFSPIAIPNGLKP